MGTIFNCSVPSPRTTFSQLYQLLLVHSKRFFLFFEDRARPVSSTISGILSPHTEVNCEAVFCYWFLPLQMNQGRMSILRKTMSIVILIRAELRNIYTLIELFKNKQRENMIKTQRVTGGRGTE